MNFAYAPLKSAIPTPRELNEARDSLKRILINAVEKQIVDELKAKFLGVPVEIWIDGSRESIEKIMPELKRSFSASGWEIDIIDSFSDQKDGDRIRFRLSDIHKVDKGK